MKECLKNADAPSPLDARGLDGALRNALRDPGLYPLATLMVEGLRGIHGLDLPTGGTARLFRGARLTEAEYAAWQSAAEQVVLLPTFTSFSTRAAVAARFPVGGVAGTGDVEVIFELETVGRPPIADRSAFAPEDEVLFHPFSAFEVSFVGTFQCKAAAVERRVRRVIGLRDLSVVWLHGAVEGTKGWLLRQNEELRASLAKRVARDDALKRALKEATAQLGEFRPVLTTRRARVGLTPLATAEGDAAGAVRLLAEAAARERELCERAAQERDQAMAELGAVREQRDRLLRERGELAGKVEPLAAELQRASKAAMEARAELTAVTEERGRLLREKAELAAELQKASKAATEARARLAAAAEEERGRLLREKAELAAELQKVKAANQELRQQIGAAQGVRPFDRFITTPELLVEEEVAVPYAVEAHYPKGEVVEGGWPKRFSKQEELIAFVGDRGCAVGGEELFVSEGRWRKKSVYKYRAGTIEEVRAQMVEQLFEAIHEGDVGIVLNLILAGVDVNARPWGISALKCAMAVACDITPAWEEFVRWPYVRRGVRWGSRPQSIIQLLLLAGADPTEEEMRRSFGCGSFRAALLERAGAPSFEDDRGVAKYRVHFAH